MQWMSKLRDAWNRATSKNARTSVARQEIGGEISLNPLCSTYENVFAQVRPLIDELKTVRPYGVGRNGARLPIARTPELQVLDYPNEEMGWAEFADLMFAMWLTESELNIHVWKNQRNKIYGYSILPVNSRVSLGNGSYYFETTDASGKTIQLNPSEVMTLRYSRSPRNLSRGVSPASSAFIWAQVDDLLAQYQRAYLENGAIPASITIIRASTQEKYQKVRHDLEGQLKGANNRNKTIYLWKQMLDDGEELEQVEVKPIQGNNSTLAIKEIMAIVNDKLNKAYGVSEFILGNDASAKYDNAELSDRQFTKRRVFPALMSFWGQFQHELDRVLGGLGYAIQWDLEIPELTDRLKVKAEISQKNVENLTNLINAGSTARAAVKALGLSDEWLDVAYSLYNEKQRRQNAETLNTILSQTPVQTSNQATPDNLAGSTQVDDHPSGEENGEEKCHTCHHCNHTHDAKTHEEVTFTEAEKTEKIICDQLSLIIASAINDAMGDGIVLTEDEMEEIRQSILSQLIDQADAGAQSGAEEIVGQLLGDVKAEISEALENGGYHVSEDFQERLKQRVEILTSRLNTRAKEVAQGVLLGNKGLSANEIKRKLSDVMPTARAETIARNETVYAFRAGHLENDKYLAQKYNLKLRKIWRISDEGACDICKAMDGKTVSLDEAFPDSVTDKDGYQYSWEHSSWNDDGEIPSAHVNCHCRFETEVIRD